MIESSDWRWLAGRTARAALFLAATGSGARPADAAAGAADLSVRVILRNSKGQVGCMLFASGKGFPGDPAAALQRKWCAITQNESVCPFDPVPAGVYAIGCFHDENRNGKLDTKLFGIPAEGTVTSNHAKGFLGPPSFDDAKFSVVAGRAELRLRVDY